MREILDFFKDILMISNKANTGIGLSQFNRTQKEIVKVRPKKQPKKQLTLSELMSEAN